MQRNNNNLGLQQRLISLTHYKICFHLNLEITVDNSVVSVKSNLIHKK